MSESYKEEHFLVLWASFVLTVAFVALTTPVRRWFTRSHQWYCGRADRSTFGTDVHVRCAQRAVWAGVPSNGVWRAHHRGPKSTEGRYVCSWCGKFSHPRALQVAAHAPVCPECPHILSGSSRRWWPAIDV